MLSRKLAAGALALTLLLSACTSTTPSQTEAPTQAPASTQAQNEAAENTENGQGKFVAGTYTASTMGNNGTLQVSVTFSEDEILSIELDECVETVGLGTAAIEKMSEQITTNQSLNVDTVTGATYTSGAFLTAVIDCVKQAQGDVDALRAAPIEEAPATQEEISCDLVVVGGGSAGMIAAIRAAEAGLDVVILEKMVYTGGASMIAGGNMVIAGSQYQKDKGVTDDTPQSLIEDLKANGSNLNDTLLLGLYAENIGSTVDWAMEKVGLAFVDADLIYGAEYTHDRQAALLGGAAGYAQTLRTALDATNAKLMLETKAEKLIVEDGAVTGVEATASNGSTYTIKAKSVILATGGYGNNVDMLTEELQKVLYYGPMSSTGDGQLMAQEVNAKFELMEYGKSYPNGVEVAQRIGKSTIYGNLAAFDISAILINKGGERVVNERASNRTILNAQLAAEGQQLYLFMDAASYDAFSNNLSKNSITKEDLERWLANNGSTTPVLVKGDSIEEVASIIGIDSATLQATVDKYNGFVQSGEDQDFGRLPSFMTAEIGAGPYYIVEQKPRFATTMGSLMTTESLQVLNESGEPIPNLYAAGEIVNGVHGDDSASGANLGWALTSGRLAADGVIAAQAQQ